MTNKYITILTHFFALVLSLASADAMPTLEVTRQGNSDAQSILMIPGLSNPGSVWRETAAALESDYDIHILTLPGFAGQPALSENAQYFPTVANMITSYVQSNKLEYPVLLGHSLGGFLSFYLASENPNLFGPVIAVDGVPYLPALANPAATAEQNATPAKQVKMFYSTLSAEQFAMQNEMAMDQMVAKPKSYPELLEAINASDPTTVGLAVSEMMTTDLRQSIRNITQPVMLIAAVGEAGEARAEKYYAPQLAELPDAKLVAAPTKHFVMLDDLEFLLETLRTFLDQTEAQQ